MLLAKNIRYLRTQKCLGQEDLANMLGYKSYTTIQKWESGVSEPPLKTLNKLANIFKIDMDKLTSTDLSSPCTEEPKLVPIDLGDTVRIPVYGRIPAGTPIEAIEDISDYIDVDKNTANKYDLFALTVVGDSMLPDIKDGDTVLLKAQPFCESREICAVRVNGNDATLKKVIKEMDGIMLQPLNPEYPPKKYDYNDELNPVEILGVVIELRRKL